MATSLLDALERLQPGDHLCSIYENETEQLASVVPYLRSGLERGEKCMCFGDERLLGGVRSALRAAGVDVSLAVRSGDLMLTAKREEFFDDGRFVPERWNQLWRGGAEKAAQEGYTAFRATGVADWVMHVPGNEQWMEYESRVSDVIAKIGSRGMCLYDRRLCTPQLLLDVIRTHPTVIFGETVCRNFYFVPPREFLAEGSAEREVERLLQTLQDRERAAQELEAGAERIRHLYREAQRAIHLRDEFLLVAAHELRTPVTSLTLSLQTLRRRERLGLPAGPEVMSRSVGIAASQGERLNRLIEAVLDFSHIETGRLALDLGDVELGAVVRDVVERFEVDLDRAGCKVTIRGDAAVMGRWDRLRIDQVITNLLSNAIKFGAGKPVEILFDQQAGTARLTVRDQGIGIDEAEQVHIFERFARAVSTHNYGGLGLGLYISRRIVEAHGGSIRVESQPGSGSSFTVELPSAEPVQA